MEAIQENSNVTTQETAITTQFGPYKLTDADIFDLIKYQFYIWEGLAIAIANFLLVAVVVYHKELRARKEYIIMSSLGLLDALSGMGYFTAGIYRSNLIFHGVHRVQVSAQECLYKLHNIFFILGESPSGVHLSLVTLDRLVAVYKPTNYFKFGAGYALKLCTPFFLYYLAFYITSIVVCYAEPTTKQYDAICFTSYVFGDNYFWRAWYMDVRAAGGVLSVVFYLIVFYRTKKHFSVANLSSERQIAERMAKQRRINHTIGICTACTLFLFCIPTFGWSILESFYPPEVLDIFGPVVMSVANLNPFLNLFIYVKRHKDLLYGLKMLFRCKQLTKQQIKQLTTHGVTQAKQVTTHGGTQA